MPVKTIDESSSAAGSAFFTKLLGTSEKPSFPIHPIRGRVILKMDELGEVVSDGGIVTDLNSDQSLMRRDGTCRTGVVMAIDKDHKDSPDGVNVGDRVFFQVSWAGEGWEYQDVKYHTLEGEDVAALVDHDADLIGLTR